MHLRNYFKNIERSINLAKFLSSYSLSFEERPPFLGLIKGMLTFIDGSQLHFTEFIDSEKGIEKVKYRYLLYER